MPFVCLLEEGGGGGGEGTHPANPVGVFSQ